MSIEIEKILRENKPEITESTIKAYMLNLQKLHDRLHGTKEFSDIEWLKQSDDVMASLDKHCSSYLTIRNYLNAVIVVLLNREDFATALEKYQSKRDTLNDKYNEIQATKEPTEKQQANWVSVSDIEDLIEEYDRQIKRMKEKTDLTVKDMIAYQDRFMLQFWMHYPLRNDLNNTCVVARRAFNALDRNERESSNFIIQGKVPELSIGNYKTRKKYGVKKIPLEDKSVLKAMRQWLEVSPNPDYILVNVKQKTPMSSLQITQNLIRIFKKNFNKNVGSTLLRHIVLTEKFGQQLQEMEDMADVCCHGVTTAHKVYIKNVDTDAPKDGITV